MASFPGNPIAAPMDENVSRSSSSTPPTSPEVSTRPLKRKEHPDSEEEDELEERRSGSPSGQSHPDIDKSEYESGRIVCEHCQESIPIRDDNGHFTKDLWEQHRKTHSAPPTSSRPAAPAAPESSSVVFVPPPTKRRRAKRTEEERIEYLKSDPYVEKYEAYRVLCKSCDKWIRLRPNSTYCSIPWDAHRKSCLAKKVNSKNVYALEERNNHFSKDPEVRKFDQERVLCNICDEWIAVDPEDHSKAVQTWMAHRGSCRKPDAVPGAPSNSGEIVSPALSSASIQRRPAPAPSVAPSAETSSPKVLSLSSLQHQTARSPGSASSFQELTPANYAPAHESRRRNAEQRAATLRADHLIGMVEPNRVFCSLCQKWVQLRQDSTYCAYPWLQHRGKCLARHQRRQQKAAEVAAIKARRQSGGHRPHNEDIAMLSEDDQSDAIGEYEEPRSHMGHIKVESRDDIHDYRHRIVQPPTTLMSPARHYSRPSSHSRPLYHPYQRDHRKTRSIDYPSTNGHPVQLARRPSTSHTYPYTRPISPSSSRPRIQEEDAEGDVDADGEVDEEHVSAPPPPPRSAPAPARRSVPASLADLDSPLGRRNFIFASVKYLFSTTYEATDDMSISTLLTYLNAAMPVDKHEDFDTSEVIKAVAALQDKGKIRFEGDMLRPILH